MARFFRMCAYSCLALVVLGVLTTTDAFFINSLNGLYSDVVQRPVESLSLVALKSFLFGNLAGRAKTIRHFRPVYYPGRPHQPVYYPVQGPYHRGRRSNPDEEPLSEQDFLDAINKMDKCVTRLVCEVEAGLHITNEGMFEEMVHKVFGSEEPEKMEEEHVFPSVYHYAAFLGQRVQSVDECRGHFPKCKSPSSEYRKLAERIFDSSEL